MFWKARHQSEGSCFPSLAVSSAHHLARCGCGRHIGCAWLGLQQFGYREVESNQGRFVLWWPKTLVGHDAMLCHAEACSHFIAEACAALGGGGACAVLIYPCLPACCAVPSCVSCPILCGAVLPFRDLSPIAALPAHCAACSRACCFLLLSGSDHCSRVAAAHCLAALLAEMLAACFSCRRPSQRPCCAI